MKITFLGAAGTVTGSKILIESQDRRILVDCGMFQGIKPLREKNWDKLPIPPASISFVLLTHGHLDHCGWLPVLVRNGFKGKIYCTAPTKEITRLILLDSAKIQEEEAALANQKKISKHLVAKPLYNTSDALKVIPLIHIIKPQEQIFLYPDISARFFPAGHILGACSIEVTVETKTLIFSGDLGRNKDPLMFPYEKPTKADYVFLESTYGNQIHPTVEVLSELEAYIGNTIGKGGTVIIPGFAVERAQMLMYYLWQLRKQDRLPHVPCIVDSPMGVNVLEIFKKYHSWHKLDLLACEEMAQTFRLVNQYRETESILMDKKPKIVIAASGMITGGRVLTYLQHYIGKPETTLILVGFQAEGTRGRKLLEGAKEIKIYGKYYPVVANIIEIKGLSAHADSIELLQWLSELKPAPKRIFLVHGENSPTDELRIKIEETYQYKVTVPLLGQQIEL